MAGVLALIGMAGLDTELIDQHTMFAVLASGYAGTDFIEGFMKRQPPSTWSDQGREVRVVEERRVEERKEPIKPEGEPKETNRSSEAGKQGPP